LKHENMENSTARALPALRKRATHPNDTRAGHQHYRGPLTAEKPKRKPLLVGLVCFWCGGAGGG